VGISKTCDNEILPYFGDALANCLRLQGQFPELITEEKQMTSHHSSQETRDKEPRVKTTLEELNRTLHIRCTQHEIATWKAAARVEPGSKLSDWIRARLNECFGCLNQDAIICIGGPGNMWRVPVCPNHVHPYWETPNGDYRLKLFSYGMFTHKYYLWHEAPDQSESELLKFFERGELSRDGSVP
jgi:hypothetical protein